MTVVDGIVPGLIDFQILIKNSKSVCGHHMEAFC
jgi:hypothetical protein